MQFIIFNGAYTLGSFYFRPEWHHPLSLEEEQKQSWLPSLFNSCELRVAVFALIEILVKCLFISLLHSRQLCNDQETTKYLKHYRPVWGSCTVFLELTWGAAARRQRSCPKRVLYWKQNREHKETQGDSGCGKCWDEWTRQTPWGCQIWDCNWWG